MSTDPEKSATQAVGERAARLLNERYKKRVEQYIRMLLYRCVRGRIGASDIFQNAAKYFIKSKRVTDDPSLLLPRFMVFVIRNICHTNRDHTAQKRDVNRETQRGAGKDDERDPLSAIPDRDELTPENNMIIAEWVASLSEEDSVIMIMGDAGHTTAEIANELCCSTEKVRQHKKAIEKRWKKESGELPN